MGRARHETDRFRHRETTQHRLPIQVTARTDGAKLLSGGGLHEDSFFTRVESIFAVAVDALAIMVQWFRAFYSTRHTHAYSSCAAG